LREADVVVLVVDAATPLGGGDRYVRDLVARTGMPSILALNKVDRVRKPALLPLIAAYTGAMQYRAVVPLSALDGDGVDRLEQEILEALPDGPPLYPDEYLTDQTERSLAAELIREKVLHHTRDELPYTTGVVIQQFDEPAEAGGLTRIHAAVLVDRLSQKPIVVGRRGELIKQIGTEARHDLEQMLGGRVFLDLHVKVRADWRDDDRLLDEMGLGGRR